MNSTILSLLLHLLFIISIIILGNNSEKAIQQKKSDDYLSISLHNVVISEENKKINNIINKTPINKEPLLKKETNKKDKKTQNIKPKQNKIIKKNNNDYNSYNKKLDSILDYYNKVKINKDYTKKNYSNKNNTVKSNTKKNNNTVLNNHNQKSIKKVNKIENINTEKDINKKISKVKYIKKIRDKIYSNWDQLGHSGSNCYVEVFQNKFGSVININFSYCKNKNSFKNSIKKAIYLSSPFPLPKDKNNFETKLSFTFIVD
tara:strand:- start:48027 stop:48806 length:780 start_codon:yes stop_codon:yes gene_type:complete